MEGIDYFKEFVKSKTHWYLGGICFGLAILSGNWFVLILCALSYGLGLTFIHETPYFQKQIDAKYNAIINAQKAQEFEKFKTNRDKQLASLTKTRKDKYSELSLICKEIEKATLEQVSSEDGATDIRLKRLDELMFTYLKLLSIEQSLQIFIESEKDEDVNNEVEIAEKDVSNVSKEIDKLKADPNNAKNVESKQRLLTSYQDRLDVLKKRLEKYEQAKNNVQLVLAEQARLSEQIKLLRADSIASRNAENITSRIDASVTHLDETNKWLSELNEFKDVVGDIPQSNTRIGFEVPENIDSDSDNGKIQSSKSSSLKLKINRQKIYE